MPDAAAPVPPSRQGRGLLLAAVFLTGATALAYEVAWTRGLAVVLGATATTAAVVLAVFVGALGLGARWGGHKADAHPCPLALYGILELAAALWALLSFFLADHGLALLYVPAARALPAFLHLPLRILFVAALVGPAAFLLGATLPALVRHWVRDGGQAGRGTAWLYGANTLGAVLGAWGTGFVLVARFGVGTTVLLAAALASVVGLGALAFGRRLPRRARAPVPALVPTPDVGAGIQGALLAAFLCGAIGLGVEIAGFRILVFFIEGFTLTFAAMLGVFVLGLGAGSLLLGSWMARSVRPERWLALLLVAAAAILFVEIVVVVPDLEPWMRGVKAAAYRGAASPVEGLRQAAIAGSMAVLFAPAFVLGATFSLTVRQAELAGLPPGEAVGRVYLANSAGTVLAPFLVTFGLMPCLGPEGAWTLFAFVALGAAGVVLGLRRRPLLALGIVALVGGVGAWILAPAEPGRALVEASHVLAPAKHRKALRVETDASTTASVIETPDGERILYTDDFAAAATGRHYRYMRMLGHLPVLLAAQPKHAMVIAFGTGTTAGAVAAHEEVERIEVVEVSRAVLDLAPYFEAANRGVLQDPRTRVIRDDGRNVLLLHEPDLDVITLEPLMPYSPAGLPFYTKEFYELARDRLREGGVVCQWVPVHAMEAGLYAALLRTFFEVFPDGSLWFFEQSTALIGRKGEAHPNAETLARRRAHVAEDLDVAGLGDEDAFLGAWIASGRIVLAAPLPSGVFDRGPVTDLDPYPEFFPTPRAPLLTPYLQDTLGWLERLIQPGDVPPVAMTIDATRQRMIRNASRRALAARRADAWATRLATLLAGRRSGDARAKAEEVAAWREAEAGYADALDMLDGDQVLRWRLARAAGRAAVGEALLLAPRATG